MAMDKIINLHNNGINEATKILNMKSEIEKERVLQQYSKIQTEKQLRENLVIDPSKDYKQGDIASQNEKFQDVMEKKLPFMNDILSHITCVASNTIYLIGGPTGGGKSTIVANIIIPLLEAQRRILVISNEEQRNHVFVRVACRILGLSFIKWTRGELHQSVRDRINQECEKLSKIMKVVGTDFQNEPKFVTTPEGLEKIFNKYAENYEVILFDYFQNISHSVVNPDPSVWPHQEKFCYFINEFKNRFNGPIFIMSQLWPPSARNTVSFLERIKGRKAIGDVSMVHLEVMPNKEDYTSTFVIHKDRLWNNDGMSILLGFDRDSGKYVKYDDDFKSKSASWIANRTALAAGNVPSPEIHPQEESPEDENNSLEIPDDSIFDK